MTAILFFDFEFDLGARGVEDEVGEIPLVDCEEVVIVVDVMFWHYDDYILHYITLLLTYTACLFTNNIYTMLPYFGHGVDYSGLKVFFCQKTLGGFLGEKTAEGP